MNIKRHCSCILIMLLTVALISANVYAQVGNDPTDTDTLQIPDEMDFHFQDTCSGHDYFYHVAVREDGWFAVFYRTAIHKLHDDEYLSRIYVDIFNERGEFQKEISFKSEYDIALELGNTLRIYDYDFVISYDWVSDALEIERTPKNYAHISDIYENFARKEFELGGWLYRCDRTLMGYCTIVRTNGEQEETLLSLSGNIPGMGVSLESRVIAIIVTTVVLGIVGVPLAIVLLKKAKRSKK